MAYTLNNLLSVYPCNANEGYNNSWIEVENNAGRLMYAQAHYITNLDDINISLGEASVSIGSIEINDPNNHNIKAGVADVGNGLGALRVLSQDLEPVHDTVSLGDVNANYVGVYPSLSALKVYVTNNNYATSAQQVENNNILRVLTGINVDSTSQLIHSLSSINATVLNQITAVTVLNPVTAVSLLNQLTALTISNPVTSITILNPVSSVSLVNQLTSLTIDNPVTAVTILNPVTSVSLDNQLTSLTVSNPITAVTVLNPVTSVSLVNQLTGITILNSVTAVTVLNPITAVSLVNQLTALTISNPITAVTILNPVTSVSLVASTSGGFPITFADTPQIDQSGRLRVSMPGVQWWYNSTVDKDGDLRMIESFTSGATSLYIQNLANVFLTSGTASDGKAIRLSRRRQKVRPGMSHQYFGVWNWDGKQTNVVKRMGMYTSYNGYFFELSGTDMNVVVRRRLIDGTLVEERVEQNYWNGDKLDGNGPSKENWSALTATGNIASWVSTTPINIGATTIWNVVYTMANGDADNFRQGSKVTVSGVTPSTFNGVALISNYNTVTSRLTASYVTNPGTYSSMSNASMLQTGYHMMHTFWFDFMGGRTNRVRFGKVSDYGDIVLHTFNFDGLLGTAYENAPALTDRKEIFNTGAVAYTPSFTVDGVTFSVEAEADLNPGFGIATNNTPVPYVNVGEEYPILGVALREGEPYQRADIQIQSIQILDTINITSNSNGASYAWRLVLNPTIGGTIPAHTHIGKATRQWKYTQANTVSGGIDLVGGYCVSRSLDELRTSLNFLNLGSNVDNTDSDQVVLVVKMIAKSQGNDGGAVAAHMNFIEAL